MNTMTYKDYMALIEYDEESEAFVGSVLNLSKQRIHFYGATIAELKKHMKEAVEGHIANCRKMGIAVESPHSGRITYRTTPKNHAELIKFAAQAGKRSVNALIDDAIKHYTSHILENRP